ncbi:excinuclease ABC subunit UvrC [Dethiobacter alkaliphilus]|uniref:UvrABC system protein C n=1 Tax=Dethiobacter alkaliphilus AHT 1 TaxID=555088 RepID=C0GF99_DETAL|nr:excinuclease ABC subunit UvrC [Dethiobacter alkaliphilus]EEG77859.1 excinuclease ABC, C subunit [Dethiobacter alkaliphilus AHT 1]
MTEKDTIQDKLARLPRRPGVYLMKDQRGKIIYVGKAVDLRQRVRSYFQSAQKLSPKVRALVEKIADLDYTVTDTEVEALILESNLIKEYKPRYNIDLKDDKHYPYLRVTVQEPFPRIHVARRVEKDGARYFGPYTNAGAVRETIRLIRRLFPLRHCRGPVDPAKSGRPCLNRHIDRCLAPCDGEVGEEEYRKLVDEVLLFLEGKQDRLLHELAARMEEAAQNLEFEKAARLRDQYQAVEAIREKQKIALTEGGDRDIIALAAGEDLGCAQLFAVRGGKLTGREHFLLTNPTGEDEAEMLAAFLRRYYTHAGEIPPEILLSGEIPDAALLEEWLRGKRGGRVRIHVPQRGAKKDLARMALDNAAMFLEQEVLRQRARDPQAALRALTEALSLEEPPCRIEGYDISHLHGEGTVAAMVVFENGVAKPSDYRRFRVRSVDKPDDYASMRETLSRRFARLAALRDAGEPPENMEDPFLLVPDLILIDGGIGQLNAARQAMEEAGYNDVPMISLAKEEELVFVTGRREPLRLPRNSAALQLLQRVRDEAHRFVITYQRKRRPGVRGSLLLDVPGIGEARRKALLKHFGSIAEMRRASVEQLAEVEGMNEAVAATLYEYLREEDRT